MIRSILTSSATSAARSIIELALVAPILASLLIGMVDISRAYSAKLPIEQAAQRAIEKVQQTGERGTRLLTRHETDAAATAAGYEKSRQPSPIAGMRRTQTRSR